eukprot:s9371_g2.t1
MFTHETHVDFARRLRLCNPVERLLRAVTHRANQDDAHDSCLRPGDAQLQWRAVVRGHLTSVTMTPTAREERCRLQLVQDVLREKFECTECGQHFISQAALRRHEYGQRLTEEQRQDRKMVSKRDAQPSVMDHSLDGMPQCKHCSHVFSTWHAFYYHVNTQSCKQLRVLASGQSPTAQEITLSDAVVENSECKGPRGHKNNQRGKPKGYGGSWQQQSQGRHQAWDQEWDSQDSSERETEENLNLRMIVKLLSTLVLRHESQHCINRLDTGYVVFLKTDLPDNLATSTYMMAQKWHALKTKEPEELEAPTRMVLLQHLFMTVKTKLMKMLETPSSRSTAVALGWLSTDEAEIMGRKWDQEQRRHVQDDQVKPLKVEEVKEALDTLILKVKEPLVVARYHATRPLSEQYQSPTLAMLLEVGLRTDAAHETWKLLRKLSQSAAWVAAGAFIRPEKIQRSPLAQKLATLLQSLN